jgi:hypothetical protein
MENNVLKDNLFELCTLSIINLIKLNLIAKTDLISDANVGETEVQVYNTFRFRPNEEIVFIDWGYNQPEHEHYQVFEYSRIRHIADSNTVILHEPLHSNWTLDDKSFIQKTIGHSPLHESNVLYGDRDVIPANEIAITVESSGLTNEWMYIQGGLSEDLKCRIMIYGKSITTQEGKIILDKYSWALYQLLNNNIHLDLNDFYAPLQDDFLAGENTVTITDTDEHREMFKVGNNPWPRSYQIQDNIGGTCWFSINHVSEGGGYLFLSTSHIYDRDFKMSDFAAIRKLGEYIYDSRSDSVNSGNVSKGSAILRAAEINWFGKRINEHLFVQQSLSVPNFPLADGVIIESSSE